MQRNNVHVLGNGTQTIVFAHTCLEESLDLLAFKAAEKEIELGYSIHPETPNTIVADVTRLRQILVNLVGNAVKFTEKGEVIVSVMAAPLTVNGKQQYLIEFAVKDTGIGIPAQRMDRLFQSFSQVDASTAIAQGNATELRQAAHTLKASSMTLGATNLSNFCKELETMGRNGHTKDGIEKLSLLKAEYERVKVTLQIERQQNKVL